jgi:hypothetical protein
MAILDHLKTIDGFKVVDGELSYGLVTIDLLTTIDDKLLYEQINEYVESIQGIVILKPDFALAAKVKCAYLRADDDNGIKKRTYKTHGSGLPSLRMPAKLFPTHARNSSKSATIMSSSCECTWLPKIFAS